MEKAEAILRTRMMGTAATVENVLKRKLGVIWFKPNEEDQIRLLTLAVWAEKYRVSIEWILKQLVPYWKNRFSRYRGSKGLGVTVATLTGKKSEIVLKQKVLEAYPDGENRVAWRVKEQARQWDYQWDHQLKKEDWENPHEVILQYQRRVVAERRERNIWVRKRKRRKYRSNPWLGD